MICFQSDFIISYYPHTLYINDGFDSIDLYDKIHSISSFRIWLFFFFFGKKLLISFIRIQGLLAMGYMYKTYENVVHSEKNFVFKKMWKMKSP